MVMFGALWLWVYPNVPQLRKYETKKALLFGTYTPTLPTT